MPTMLRTLTTIAFLLLLFGCNNEPLAPLQLQTRETGATIIKQALQEHGAFFIIPKNGALIDGNSIRRVFQKNGHHIFILSYFENTDSKNTEVAELLYKHIFEK